MTEEGSLRRFVNHHKKPKHFETSKHARAEHGCAGAEPCSRRWQRWQVLVRWCFCEVSLELRGWGGDLTIREERKEGNNGDQAPCDESLHSSVQSMLLLVWITVSLLEHFVQRSLEPSLGQEVGPPDMQEDVLVW